MALLTELQLDTTPRPLAVREPTLPTEPSRRPWPRSEQPEPYHAYVLNLGLEEVPDEIPLEVDSSLEPLRFMETAPTLHPRIAVHPYKDAASRLTAYYFEVDTVDTFDSPNFWRAPQLLPWHAVRDIPGRAGVKYRAFTSGHHEPHTGPVFKFPFRATAMSLPDDWQTLDRTELERHALGLGYGLDREAAIREVFDWVRHTIVWSAQTKVRSTLDVFCAGLGACGQANALCSLYLELNGVRTRGVSGFDPIIRHEKNGRGGGHSVAEYYDEKTGQWSYIDPYLDLLLPGISASELAHHSIGDHALGAFTKLRSLKRQFMYRRYFDRLNRMASPTMLQCDQATWGTQWPLIEPPKVEPKDLFPERITIHVRARYILTNGQSVLHRSTKPEKHSLSGVRASPWAKTRFTVRPHELLGL